MLLRTEIKVVLENFFSLIVLKGGNYIFPLIYLPYVVKTVGIYNFGLISFAEAIVLFFKAFTDYGFDLTGTRSIANNKLDTDFINRKVSLILSAKFVLVFLSFFVFIILLYSVPSLKEEKPLFLYTFLSVFGYAMLPTWFFQGIEKMRFVTIVTFVGRLIATICVLLFVKNEAHYPYVSLLNSLGFMLAGVLGLVLMFHGNTCRFFWPKFKLVIKELKSGFYVFVSTFVPNLYNNTLVFLLGIYSMPLVVGYYSAATKLIELINSIFRMLSSAAFPFLNRQLSYHRLFSFIILGTSFTFSVCLLFFAEPIISFFYNDAAENSAGLLQVMAFSPFFVSCMFCFGTNYLVIIRKDKLVMQISMIGSLFGFTLALYFIPLFFAEGAAWILLATRGVLALGYFLFFLRYAASCRLQME